MGSRLRGNDGDIFRRAWKYFARTTLQRYEVLRILGAVLTITTASVHAADTYPTRPLRLIVPYFTGGTPDLQGRALAEHLRTRLAQPVVVDNRPGANGSIGVGLVARAPADGYTLLIAPVGCVF